MNNFKSCVPCVCTGSGHKRVCEEHNKGNTLDHIYTESIDMLEVRHSFIGEYISDHRLVGIEISKKKATTQLDNWPRRQFKQLDLDSFTQEFRNEEILKHDPQTRRDLVSTRK